MGKKGELRCVKANKSVTEALLLAHFIDKIFDKILDLPVLRQPLYSNYNILKDIRQALDDTRSSEINFLSKNAYAYAKIGREFSKNVFNVTLADGCRRIPSDPAVIEEKPHGHAVPVWQIGDGALLGSHLIGTVQKHREDGCRLFLLDEPEQNLHPKAVEALIKELWEISKDTQIILTSHSPVLVEAVCRQAQAAGRKPEDYFRILSKNPGTGIIRAQLAEPFLLNPVSADEINYCAFGYPTAFYFIQLFGKLKEQLQVRQKNERISEDDIVRKDLKEITKKRKTLGKCVPWKDKYPGEKEEEDTAIFIRHFCNTLKHSQFKKIKYSPNDLLPELIEALRALIEYNNDIGNNRHLSKHPSLAGTEANIK